MTQQEFSWEFASLESTIRRIAEISEAERDLLVALVKIYQSEKERNGRFAEGRNGIVSVEPSKKEMADAIGVAVSTIKRRLKAIRGSARFIAIKGDNWRSHVYDIDFQAIYSAKLIDAPKVRQEFSPGANDQESKNSRYRLSGRQNEPPLTTNEPGPGDPFRGAKTTIPKNH